jgi:hypothetical protein
VGGRANRAQTRNLAVLTKIASLVIVTTESVDHAATVRKMGWSKTWIVVQSADAADVPTARFVPATRIANLLCVDPRTNVRVAATISKILMSQT